MKLKNNKLFWRHLQDHHLLKNSNSKYKYNLYRQFYLTNNHYSWKWLQTVLIHNQVA